MRIKNLEGKTWGVVVEDLDLAQATSDQIFALSRLLFNEDVVVLRNQKLDPLDEIRVCEEFGEIERVSALYRCPPHPVTGTPLPEIQRVTGQKAADGTPMGLFGHDHDLDWHANRASAEHERKPLIWLYAKHGTEGTRTSWANCSHAFAGMGAELQSKLEPLRGIFGFEPNKYTTSNDWKSHRNYDGIHIVRDVLKDGRKCLYFPFLQLFGFVGVDDETGRNLIEEVKAHILQEKFVYHHDWKDGDVVLSEQWHTIHKRWECKTSDRMLHRISFGWDRVLPRYLGEREEREKSLLS